MHTVYKFPFDVTDDFTLELSFDAEFLYIDVQNGIPCMWFLVNTERPKETRHFAIHGTGHPIRDIDKKTHIGSFMIHGGALVFHVFENEIGQ